MSSLYVTEFMATYLIPENLLLRECLNPNANGLQFLEVLPTDVCNQDCIWCFTSDSRSTNVLPPGQLRARLEAFIAHGGQSVLLSGGGEPLFYRPLTEPQAEFDNDTAIGWLAANGIAVGLITNGVRLAPFIDANLRWMDAVAFIRVSLDACTPTSYAERHRAKASDFSAVLKAVSSLLVLRGTGTTPAIGLSFLVDNDSGLNATVADATAVSKLCAELGVDFVQLKHAHTQHATEANATMTQLHEWCKHLDWGRTQVWAHRYVSPNRGSLCAVPTVAQLIGASGSRYPCCHLQHLPATIDASSTQELDSFTVHDCPSPACRHATLNELILDLGAYPSIHRRALCRLRGSLEAHGFHPYRLFPSAPELYSPLGREEALCVDFQGM
jgi:wyosine [tRNA(Phe)-imidazoG37] synthetase (radical SAM superfamily)